MITKPERLTHFVTLRLPPQLFSSLNELKEKETLARKDEVTMSEAIRWAIEKGLKE